LTGRWRQAQRSELRNEQQLAAKTRTDYRRRLECHLLPYFAELRLDAITLDTVKRYIAAKLAEGERIRAAELEGKPIVQEYTDRLGRERKRKAQPLSARSINMTVILLAAILETAVERDLIARNPAKGRRRRAIEHAPRRSYLETLRRTFCSILYALGEDPGVVMDEMGHANPALALKVYRQAMRRGEDEEAQLRALIEGRDWANMGERPKRTHASAVEQEVA